MKLKTLKDLDFSKCVIAGIVMGKDIEEILKQEAIKWVNADKRELVEEWEMSLNGKESESPGFVCFADFCIMKMNNITEEDLK